MQTLRLIDLFAGAGGFTLGFTKHFGKKLKVVWSNDIDPDAVDTYNSNFGNHCLVGDIYRLLEDPKIKIPKADVVIGGPPCQGFSLLNKNRVGDVRKQLWRPYLDIVSRSGAAVFVIENVRELLNTPEHMEIKDVAESMGFKTAHDVLCAADYGVAQIRYRAFIIGCRHIDPKSFFPPKRTHYNPRSPKIDWSYYVENSEPWVGTKDVIGDLPEPEGTEIRDLPGPLNLHFGRQPTEKSLMRYRAIPDEGMNRFDLQRIAPNLTPDCWIRKTSGGTDLFGRLWWDRPAFTIRTEFFKPEKGRYLHPVQHRPITHREAARFQSFPDDFIFKGSKTDIARQIGNAVPPLLGEKIASVVENLLAAKATAKIGELLIKET